MRPVGVNVGLMIVSIFFGTHSSTIAASFLSAADLSLDLSSFFSALGAGKDSAELATFIWRIVSSSASTRFASSVSLLDAPVCEALLAGWLALGALPVVELTATASPSQTEFSESG